MRMATTGPKTDSLLGSEDMSHEIDTYRMFNGSILPNWLLERKELSHGAKIVYARLCQFRGKGDICKPKRVTLAGEIGMSVRQTDRYIEELIETGLIRKQQMGLHRSNRYFFLRHPWIEQCWTKCPDSTSASPSEKTPEETPILRDSLKESQITPSRELSGKPSGQVKKTGKTPNPNFRPLKVYWSTMYRLLYHVDPPFDGRRAKILSDLLQQVNNDIEKAKAVLNAFLEDESQFLEQQRHSLIYLMGNLEKYLVAEQVHQPFVYVPPVNTFKET
jgi:predicted transcriptional regulator